MHVNLGDDDELGLRIKNGPRFFLAYALQSINDILDATCTLCTETTNLMKKDILNYCIGTN